MPSEVQRAVRLHGWSRSMLGGDAQSSDRRNLILQRSDGLRGVVLEGAVSGAIIANNMFIRQAVALQRPANTTGLFTYISYHGNVVRDVERELDVQAGPGVHLSKLDAAPPPPQVLAPPPRPPPPPVAV